jgi:hypothetical protein
MKILILKLVLIIVITLVHTESLGQRGQDTLSLVKWRGSDYVGQTRDWFEYSHPKLEPILKTYFDSTCAITLMVTIKVDSHDLIEVDELLLMYRLKKVDTTIINEIISILNEGLHISTKFEEIIEESYFKWTTGYFYQDEDECEVK